MSYIALKCPSCGAEIQLDNSREFGFCNYCGTKVVQDKIIVEHRGKIKIDSSEELENLYVLARRAKNNNDSKNAQMYYEKIIVKDPSSWEANFYTVYYQSMNCVIANIHTSAVNMSNNLASTFKLIRNKISNEEEQRNIVNEIAIRTIELSNLLKRAALEHYNSIDSSIRKNYIGEYDQRRNATARLDYLCGDYIINIFGDKFSDISISCWLSGISQNANKSDRNTYHKKIKSYDPTHKIPKSKGLIAVIIILCLSVFSAISQTFGETAAICIAIVALIALIVVKVLKKKKTKKDK